MMMIIIAIIIIIIIIIMIIQRYKINPEAHYMKKSTQ